MPKIRLLAPWTNDKGEPQAVGAEVDVSEEQAQDLSNRGMASYIEDEEAAAKAAAEGGSYTARATREGTAPLGGAGQQESQPQQPRPPQQEPPKKK